MESFYLIGSIFGIISAIVLLILHASEVISIIRSFWGSLYVWVKGAPQVLREWWWWKKYCPSCEIIQTSKLWIKKPSNKYYMRLKIDVRYTSRDSRYDTLMDINDLFLDVYNTGTGRDSKPYRLYRSIGSLKIHPIEEEGEGWFPVINDIWSLPSGGNVVVRHTFEGFIDATPLVGTSASCKIVTLGEATVKEVVGSGQLKVGGKFLVSVDKDYE